MKNHFKSQLIMKRFNQQLWFYDMDNHKLELKKPNKVLFEKDIYTDEVEEKLHRIETRYSNLIDNKILNKEKIVLTRDDLYLLKKFLLIDSLRNMYDEERFEKFFKNFERSARHYFSMVEMAANEEHPKYKELYPFYKGKKYLSELNMSIKDKFMLCLNSILDSDLYSLHISDVPLDVIAWSVAFIDSYITFWDSNEKEDFILTDLNMMSEYDMCHMIYSGMPAEKVSYLLAMNKKSNYTIYTDLMIQNAVMYENFNIFNLSANRCIVCISPFFKLYSDKIYKYSNIKEKIEKPNILPSSIHHLEAFEIPETEYVISPSFMTKDDIFKYVPYKLTQDETIALNMQFLNESKKYIGFVNKEKVVNTFGYANAAYSFYDSAKVYSDNPFDNLSAMVDSLMHNKFYPIIKAIDNEGIKGTINPFLLFEKNTNDAGLDMNLNYYMYEYFLDGYNNGTLNLQAFEFLKKDGVTDLKDFLVKNLEHARKYNEEFFKDFYKKQ